MPKTLVIGDLHGKVDIVEAALSSGYFCVFVGDYVDAFDHDLTDQITTIQMVLSAVRTGQAAGLLGNHELSYLEDGMQASGFSYNTFMLMKSVQTSLLIPFFECEGFLISHAGVSNKILKGRSIEQYLWRDRFFNDIGYTRGGSSACGGLYWCDWDHEFEPVPGVKQIVGHTRQDSIQEREGNYCIDVLDNCTDCLLIEDGEAEIFSL